VWENDLLKKECHDEEQLQEWQTVSPKYYVKKGAVYYEQGKVIQAVVDCRRRGK